MSCKFPFSFIEVFSNGDVYPCCPEYCYYYCLGNIFEQSLEEIWYGSKATALRKRLLSDDHTVCNAMQCFRETMDFLLPEDDIVWDEKPPLPIAVKLSHDKECNCSCITCRDMPIRSSQQELDELNRKIETHFLPLLRNAKVVSLSGAGDPLFSRHSRQLIRRIAETYPSMRFALHTNGQLCTAPLLKELGILNRLSHVQISIHAATCGTYEHIVRGASFQRLMENLAGLRELLDKGNLRKLDLFFVIHSLNMKEIGQFSDLAKQFGANAHFWEYRYWGTEFGRDFDAVNVCSPAHPLHEELLSGLRGIANLPHIRLSPVLKGLAHPVKRRPDSQPAIFVHSYYSGKKGRIAILSRISWNWVPCTGTGFLPQPQETAPTFRIRWSSARCAGGTGMWTATRQHSTIPSITTNICRQMKPAIYRVFWIMPGASAAGRFWALPVRS